MPAPASQQAPVLGLLGRNPAHPGAAPFSLGLPSQQNLAAASVLPTGAVAVSFASSPPLPNRSPTVPVMEPGMRQLPPVSEQKPAGAARAATRAAVPPLLPAGVETAHSHIRYGWTQNGMPRAAFGQQ